MDAALPLLIPLGSVAVVLLLWWDQRRRMRRRRAALANAGVRLGLAPVGSDHLRAEEALFSLPLLREGRARRAFHGLDGRRGERRILAFDYRYATGRGKQRRTHSQTVVAVQEPGRSLPGFRLGPESLASRLGAFVGLQSLDFDGHPEFSKAYWLRAKDEPAVRELFGEPVLRFFARERDWCVEGGGEWLLVHRKGAAERRGALVPPERLGALLDAALEIAELFPRAVR